VSDQREHPLRRALKQVAVTGAASSLLVGVAVAGLPGPATTAGAAATTSPAARAADASPVRLHATRTAATTARRRVNVALEMRVAASLKGRPYRYGAAGPWAFDCSGYTQYVLKQQHWRLARTAAGQYRQTKHLSKKSAKIGDLVFFYGSGGVYHVGIFAGRGRMWAAPHTGAVVNLQKIYGSNWLIGRLV